MTESKDKSQPSPGIKAVRIRSTAPGGHRRAGRRWGREATTVALGELPAGALKALQGDPRIALEETEIDAPKPAAAKAGGKDKAAAD